VSVARESTNVAASDRQTPLCVAVLAVGGQGGGVLTDWLVKLAENNGWRAQSTSVPGVAQRTGATVYYVELFPEGSGETTMALMPSPGDVDVVITAELMEAGRAIQRGLVSPSRTTLISSTHRSYAISEKSVPGDGSADSSVVMEAAEEMSKRFVCADMSRIADDARSVISAALFGALAGAQALPFSREQYEQTVRDGGIGVETSLAAFAGAYSAVTEPVAEPAGEVGDTAEIHSPLQGGNTSEREVYQKLLARVDAEFPPAVHDMLRAGLDAVVDYQDGAYGEEYLRYVADLLRLDAEHGGEEQEYALTFQAAKYVSRAMTYDDVIRVADLKTRASRFQRVRDNLRVDSQDVVQMTEFMHPRLEEVCGTLPVGIGSAIESTAWLSALGRRFIDRGRQVRTDTFRWFLVLYAVAGLRRWRRGSLRHSRERRHLEEWLQLVRDTAAANYSVAVEVLKCRRLVKGYSGTHDRGMSKFERLIGAVPDARERADGAELLARARAAALEDEQGSALDECLALIKSN
jgi:indolepyruvate ferredoxin oxidoreductase, beta subunit